MRNTDSNFSLQRLADPRRKRLPLPRRRGYVLLITLVLLTLAATAMVAISRSALERGQGAREAKTQLQRRWGTLSCQTAFLPNAEKLIRRSELQLSQPQVCLPVSVRLGDQNFELLLVDDSAAANVKTLIERQGLPQAQETVRRLCALSPAAASVHLRSDAVHQFPESFGQIFDNASPQSFCDRSTGPSPAELLSCWGDGRINFHRATESILREVCVGVLDLTQIHRLVELQKLAKPPSLATVLVQLQLTQQKKAVAEKALADSSTCYSIWTTCHAARRSYSQVAVIDYSRARDGEVRCFEW